MILRKPDFAVFSELVARAKAEGKKMVPLWVEISDDLLTPILAFMTLRQAGVPSFLFESVTGGERVARYSYIGINPVRMITYHPSTGVVYRNFEPAVSAAPTTVDPRQAIAQELESCSCVSVSSLPPFSGGIVGVFGYDMVRLIETSIPDQNPDALGLPDMALMSFGTIIAFDHVFKKIFLIQLVSADGHPAVGFRDGSEALDLLYQQLLTPRVVQLIPGDWANPIFSNMTKDQFKHMVERSKEYIRAGDAFQIVVAQRFYCRFDMQPLTLYRCLRQTNPSPYMFYLDFGDWTMVGSSPEILVTVSGRRVMISPIAGTRPRGADEATDMALARELLADEKELAEHIMLVDLARNDVGRVAKPGTVIVPSDRMQRIERYSSVMHIVSDVEGDLRNECSPLDALFASLPAGTLSGAPKVRAMQIIEELEPTRRGAGYGGCVGFLGFTGELLESAIVIRTAVIKDGVAYWSAGSGIVYDSDPDKEFKESCNKARSIGRAMLMAGNTSREEAYA